MFFEITGRVSKQRSYIYPRLFIDERFTFFGSFGWNFWADMDSLWRSGSYAGRPDILFYRWCL